MKTQELCISRGPGTPPQTLQSASSSRNTIIDPLNTYMAPLFQESFNQVARAKPIGPADGRWVGSSLPNTRTAFRAIKSEHHETLCQRAGHVGRLP